MNNPIKILWTVNILPPRVLSHINIKGGHSISWVDAMSSCLSKRNDIKLGIVAPARVLEIRQFEFENIIYFLIPNHFPTKANWRLIISKFSPDLIHAYGTEGTHNINLIKEVDAKLPIIISLQGILSEYQKHYYAGIDLSTIIRNITLRDLCRGSIITGRKRFQRRTKSERFLLENVKYIEGRSDWDRIAAKLINPSLMYYYCPRMLRRDFYTSAGGWNIDKIERQSILVHQGNYPIKGLHIVLNALSVLVKKYPSTRLYIAGKDFYNINNFNKRIRMNGYVKILRKIIKKNKLENNIHFTGYLNSEQMSDKLIKTHVAVLPSAIENMPNSLAEAMIVGTPCVASFVGGVPEMLEHGKSGFLYNYLESGILAEYISRIFESDELAMQFSKSGKEYAARMHEPRNLESRLLQIYNDVLTDYQNTKEIQR